MPKTATIAIAAALLAACGPETNSHGSAPETVIETIGDTTIVRTLSGSVWEADATLVPELSIGEVDGPEELLFGRIASIAVDDDRNVYVMDRQAQEVRVFDSEGSYVETLGRPGEGPGEFGRADAVAVLSDGRVAVRDPIRRLIHVFGPAKGDIDQWEYATLGAPIGLKTLYADRDGRTLLVTQNPDHRHAKPYWHTIVFGPDGTHLDTLPEPWNGYERPGLRAEREIEGGGTASVGDDVPFTPDFYWTVHPSGHLLTGFSADYRIELTRDDGILRIERDIEPIAASAAERDYERERILGRMRSLVSSWSWDGPPIPDQKPFFKDLYAGRDGRIWVQVPTEGREVANEDHDLDDPRSQPVFWEEETRFDVFEEDGTYLGAVASPDDYSVYVEPVFDRDHVWWVTVDELGVQRVVRYAIRLDGVVRAARLSNGDIRARRMERGRAAPLRPARHGVAGDGTGGGSRLVSRQVTLFGLYPPVDVIGVSERRLVTTFNDATAAVQADDQPTCPECVIQLDLVTTIGSLDGPDWIPGQPFSIARDSRGRIHMAYPWEGLVPAFDAEGQPLPPIGRSGEGPGEYQNPFLVRVGRSDTVMVLDASRQLSVVTPSGSYVRRMRVPVQAVDFLVTDGGGLVFGHQPGAISAEATEATIFHVFDPVEGEVERSFHTLQVEGGGAAPRFRLASAREPDRFWAIPHNSYEVTRYATDGTVTRRFTRNASWMRRPPFRDGIGSPRPGIYGVLEVEGRLWVAGRHATEDWARYWTPEVFSEDGEATAAELRYSKVYRSVVEVLDIETGRLVTLASVPGLVIALLPDRHVATYREDDAGVPFVDVYRITVPEPSNGEN